MRYSTVIISFLVGATAGGVGTYFATKKYFEDKADKEIADMKEFIRNRAKNTEESDDYDLEKYSMEEVLQNFCRNKFGQTFDIQLAEIDIDSEEDDEELEETSNASAYSAADIREGLEKFKTEHESEAPSDEESYHEESEEDILRRLKKEERKEGRRVISPYEVSLVEFEDGSPSFDHTCLTYYIADETMLYDADGEKVDDVRRLIGQAGIDALNRQIAQKSGCFYICNKNFGQMYEVQVVDGTSGDYENYEAGFVNE